MHRLILYTFIFFVLSSCHSQKQIVSSSILHSNQETFWKELQQLCGNSYAGTVAAAPANDTVFKNKNLVMHVKACTDKGIRVPFVVGDDLSRTWVFTKQKSGLVLKHDHRHQDGSADSITMYGGYTTNSGTATVQYFPADSETTGMLPAAGGNVWWVELVPGSHFTYNLRRMGTDRLFSIRFDLTKTVAAPPAPWGWKD